MVVHLAVVSFVSNDAVVVSVEILAEAAPVVAAVALLLLWMAKIFH